MEGAPSSATAGKASPETLAEQLFEAADSAMYQAKQQGRARVSGFGQEIGRDLEQPSDSAKLRAAFDAGQLWVAYQPVLDLKTEQITGVEALLRWNDPTRGSIAPAEFIPVAEESGLILPIGEYVLRVACQQIADWNRTHRTYAQPMLFAAVNVSARQLNDPGFVQHRSEGRSPTPASRQPCYAWKSPRAC